MKGPQRVKISDVIAANQSVASGTELVLLDAASVIRETVAKIELTSSQNLSASTFTITGTDSSGVSQNEDVTGPNATTATSLNDYATITSITFTPAVAGGNVEINYVVNVAVSSDPVIVSYRGKNASFQIGAQVNVESGESVKVEVTLDDPSVFDGKSDWSDNAIWTKTNVSALEPVSPTTSVAATITSNCFGVRITATDNNATTATLTLLQD